MKRFICVTLCFLCLFGKICFSQTSLFSNTKYQLETGTYLSTSGITPFWLRSNHYGIVPLSSPILTFRGSAHKEYDSTKNENQKLKKFAIGYGFWGVANVGKQSSLLLPEAYLKVRYGVFEFYGGRRREIMGLVDTTLSSGSYIWSGNALPLPKIQVSIPNYFSIIGRGLISVKGSFSHGWYGHQTYAQSYYLHQKTLYGRIGKPHWKMNFYGGFNHQVQWGGYSSYLINDTYVSQNGFFASDFNTLINVTFPFAFVRKHFPPKISIGQDKDNYGGNQLGSIDFAGELRLKHVKIVVYRQIPYELGSLFSGLTNADDGLYGISLNLIKPLISINKLTIEGFHSFNQGVYSSGIARILKLKDNHFGEIHGYFNHGQYYDGWSYNKLGIGTPLIINNNELAIYKKDYNFSTFNQVKVFYVALEGKINKLNYGLKFNHSFNRRARDFNNPYVIQSSFLVYSSFIAKKGLHIKFSLATDSGRLLSNSTGISLSLLKNWY